MTTRRQPCDDHVLQAIETFLTQFVEPNRRERFRILANRGEFESVLYHKLEPALDDRFTLILSGAEGCVPQIQALLNAITPAQAAILIGGRAVEGKCEMPLGEALDACVGQDAALVLLDGGTVAYHEPEFNAGHRIIMTRDLKSLASLRARPSR